MPTTGPVQDMNEQREKQRQCALDKLNEWANNKIGLKRPVFFVAGWTDESCAAWMNSDKINKSIRDWLTEICLNQDQSYYINFEKESPDCNNFLDFGEVLKKKIWDVLGKNKEFDIVGHSMGGLDIRAAIALGEPLLNIRNCLTVSTPHWGDNFGGFNAWLRKTLFGSKIANLFAKETPYQIVQSQQLDPDYESIKTINKLENREAFLERVDKMFQFKGTQDFTVKGSAFIDRTGLSPQLTDKIENVIIEGADHTGKIGITKDPRTVLAILRILLGIILEQEYENYGILIGGIQDRLKGITSCNI